MKLKQQLNAGFRPSGIVFAGVGKTDKDIEAALKAEYPVSTANQFLKWKLSIPLASKLKKTATIALRINPYIEAHTHKYITTGNRGKQIWNQYMGTR